MTAAVAHLQTSRIYLVLMAVGLASCALYLGSMLVRLGHLSLPLDDAWIHLTFARNLAWRHEFSLTLGHPSAGSTSPLWSFVLAIGFLWPFGPDAWAYAVGVVLLVAIAVLTYRVTQHLFADVPVLAPISAMVIALEWHLNWAAYSGMETLLFIALLLLTLDAYLARAPLWWVGFIGGLSVVTRPEGVGMVALIAAHRLIARRAVTHSKISPARTATSLMAMAIAFALPLIPYVWFNWTTSGLLFPNTFYAKQAEFVEVFAQKSVPAHFLNLSALTFVGAQLLLAPGFLLAVWLIVKERRWDAAILLLWWLALPVVYALRLPVDYQHARYEMPVIPSVIILGLWGSWRLLEYLPVGAVRRVSTRAWKIAFPILLLVFWLRGAQAIATDVAIMDCMVVQTARWLSSNTQASDLIAVHDVGAVGYYLDGRPLVDLAGLITPEVIPFIRDESRLMQLILARNAKYLVTSAAWHPALVADRRVQEVHHRDCPMVREQGGFEMGIYRVLGARP